MASLKHGEQSVQWQAGLRTMDELIWSVSLQQDTEAGRHLVEHLPGLLKALRDGLTSAAFDPFSTRDFFVRLQALHLPPAEGVEALIEVREPLVLGPGAVDATEGLPADDPDLLKALQLRIGGWVELQDEQPAAVRCKLLAIMAPAGSYVFVNHSGLKVMEKSVGQLALAFKRDALRPLDDGPLFERALTVVIDKLRQLNPGK
ncbi:DUF1631 family protein [Pseudomonas trivialis]